MEASKRPPDTFVKEWIVGFLMIIPSFFELILFLVDFIVAYEPYSGRLFGFIIIVEFFFFYAPSFIFEDLILPTIHMAFITLGFYSWSFSFAYGGAQVILLYG